MATQQILTTNRTSLPILTRLETVPSTITYPIESRSFNNTKYSVVEVIDKIKVQGHAAFDTRVDTPLAQTPHQLGRDTTPQIVVFDLPNSSSTLIQPVAAEQLSLASPPASAAMIARLSWAEIKHYTEDLSLQDMSSLSGNLLEELESKYIATAIVRERGEVELLESEKLERQAQRSAPTPWVRTAAAASLLGSTQPNRASGRPVLERARSYRGGGSYFPDVGSGLVMRSQSAASSPQGTDGCLTPSSEAAAGQMFQKAAFARATSSASSGIKPTPAVVKQSVDVRRLLLDAAWKWIDQHVEEYADNVEHADGAEHKSQKVLWDELVGLRKQKEHLSRALDSLIVT